MSLSVARSKLMTSLKELHQRWDRVRLEWDDPVSREFEKRHIEPLEAQTRSAVAAIENMTQVVGRARAECD